jgi:hypothetical protein
LPPADALSPELVEFALLAGTQVNKQEKKKVIFIPIGINQKQRLKSWIIRASPHFRFNE